MNAPVRARSRFRFAPRTLQIEWDIHSWVGVLASLLLFVIFYCGLFALFHGELGVWEDPRLHAAPRDPSSVSVAEYDDYTQRLEREGLLRDGVDVGFAIDEHSRFVRATVHGPHGDPDAREHLRFIDPMGDGTLESRSHLAESLYELHYLAQLPGGMQIAGLLSVALLVIVVSGLIYHLKNLRRQWWQWRPGARRRLVAADAHKVLGVFTLPFVVVLAWSGTALSLGGLVVGGIAQTNFGGDLAAVQEVRGYGGAPAGPAHEAGDVRPLSELVAAAQRSTQTSRVPGYAGLEYWNDANAWAFIYVDGALDDRWKYVFVDGEDASILLDTSHHSTAVRSLEEPLFSLHFGWFGGAITQVLYAVLGLAVCVTIVSGNLVWLERRRKEGQRRGSRILARLTVGICQGLVLASSVYFGLNRALPGHWGGRGDLEWWGFLAVWLCFVGLAALRVMPERRMLAVGSAAAAIAFGAVVLVDLAAQPVNIATALGAGVPAVFAVEVLLLALAVGEGCLAWQLARPADEPLRL